ncbi:MAG: hypothetical protein JWM87_1086 [Candidatus Eremiobacteraeota bacterium]|nr:hypothetical protein [Candidatus Eremiobacteraeota bacterium]
MFRDREAPVDSASLTPCANGLDHRPAKPGDTFVYDIAIRFNETLVASIDAIDTALMAILAGDMAVTVFAIDKIKELQPIEEWCAIALVCGSIVSCIIGYAVGFSVGSSGREGVPPRRLIPDLYARPNSAISDAVEQITDAGEINLDVRFVKHACAVAAIILLVLACTVAGLARLAGGVVH